MGLCRFEWSFPFQMPTRSPLLGFESFDILPQQFMSGSSWTRQSETLVEVPVLISSSPMKPTTLTLVVLLSFAGATGCQLPSGTQNIQGVREFNAGNYNSASQRFRSVTLDNPRNPDGHYNLASTLHQMAYLKSKQGGTKADEDEVRNLQIQAETMYLQCLDRNEEHVECHRGLAVLLVEMGRSEQAFKLLNGWASRSPQSADPKTELGRLYEEHGDLDTALLQLQQAIPLGGADSRSSSRAWAAAGLIRERQGDLAQAEANFRRAYALNKDQPGVGVHLAALNRRIAGDALRSTERDTRIVRQPNSGGRY